MPSSAQRAHASGPLENTGPVTLNIDNTGPRPWPIEPLPPEYVPIEATILTAFFVSSPLSTLARAGAARLLKA
ncbi:hypothetical protein [Methylorubrum thiocyanatum]|uniref:Uncharacterized protein n=1 Tax=Methylorubrum thiocyanatum TaxID=47958 RepID=A0AA40VDS9_9HYPH|nr:hypothetical protein [Methylorubrum thiocyanatum]MBA8916242.1 hypothetical protein [Methylorubrum thiocyanatum]GJE83873.1 hypothetical protein CJNNKLLH_5252 [Methylorubrum thiocyanatum]